MKVYVANAPGEDYDPTVPDGYDSWIDYWNKSRYPNEDYYASACFSCGEETDDLDGGHVYCLKKRDDGGWKYDKLKGLFIIPLCSVCNNPKNTKPFQVDDSDLIKVP